MLPVFYNFRTITLQFTNDILLAKKNKSTRNQNNSNSQLRKGQIPFGYDYVNGKYVRNKSEQDVIRMMKQLKSNGFSLRNIAEELNKQIIPTKNNGIWQANTVKNFNESYWISL